jgi:type IV pilus assembly protein PilM
MSLFARKSKQVIGLDISSTSVKLVELSASGDGYQVESFAIKALPKGAVVEKNINDVDAVAETIRQVVSLSRTKVKDAAVAVAGSAVITKIIDMPAGLNDDALEYQITIDADQYIPFPLDEVAIDFEVLGQESEESDQMQVLLAACRRENIELRTAVLEQAGLHPKVIDVEAYAIERISPFIVSDWDVESDQLIAIVDIGATVTTLSVLSGDKTIYTREQLFGGNNLTEEIQRRYGLSQPEAELAKSQGGLPDDYLIDVLEPFKDTVLQQVTRSLQFFYSSGNYNQVDHIVLAGGVASIDGLGSLVQSHLDTLVSIANPFLDMKVSSKVNQAALLSAAPGLIIAAGLAMRSFV